MTASSTKYSNIAMSERAEQSDVIRTAVNALDRMGLRYAIGGSIASSTYGAPSPKTLISPSSRLQVERVNLRRTSAPIFT